MRLIGAEVSALIALWHAAAAEGFWGRHAIVCVLLDIMGACAGARQDREGECCQAETTGQHTHEASQASADSKRVECCPWRSHTCRERGLAGTGGK